MNRINIHMCNNKKDRLGQIAFFWGGISLNLTGRVKFPVEEVEVFMPVKPGALDADFLTEKKRTDRSSLTEQQQRRWMQVASQKEVQVFVQNQRHWNRVIAQK